MTTPEIKLLRKESFSRLIQLLLDSGQQVYAPIQESRSAGYTRISRVEQVAMGEYPLPKVSAKSILFPRTEKLFSYVKTKEGVTVRDFEEAKVPDKVVIGLRPCDAAGLTTVEATFSAAPADSIVKTRMERTTVIGVSCTTADNYCFCTSVGGGPGNTKGSDILLTPVKNGDYIAEILTGKGQKIRALDPSLFEEAGQLKDPERLNTGELKKEDYLARVAVKFDSSHLYEKINAAFASGIFEEQAMRCIGCGACAYVCPVCTCFDIQDETRGSEGRRLRCWDSCGFELFTRHTSGHNPRVTQGQRWRQRLMHKFSYLHNNLNLTGCEGCGRCSRNCPADMNLAEHLKQITELS
jgi:ferredoxin